MSSSTRRLRFVFVRHGNYDKPTRTAARARAPLNAKGREAARRAGEFLREHGVVPDLVCTTDKQRTIDTADLVLEVLGVAPPRRIFGGGFKTGAKLAEIEARLLAWSNLVAPPPRVLMFVGHHAQQNACLRELGGAERAERKHAAVLVYDWDPDGRWTLGPQFEGS
jgi:broad specificity phosphatase PhoE